MMGYANGAKKGVEPLILATPIGLHSNNFTVEHSLNKALKFLKEFKHLRFMVKKINPCETTKIIDETDIVFLMTKGINNMTPHI
jgi:hypothetical protein